MLLVKSESRNQMQTIGLEHMIASNGLFEAHFALQRFLD